jgi:ankyrin repeat protein
MLKRFLKKTKYTKVDFSNELLNHIFNKDKIDEIYNEDMDLNSKNENGESFLHLCSKNAYLKSVHWLIDKGVDLETLSNENETAIFYASQSNNTEIVKFLIDEGINVNHLNKHKRTALQEAVIAGKRTINILLENTKLLNNSDKYGNNVVFDTIANGNQDVINKIIANKNIDINHVNNYGNTILHKDAVLKDNSLAINLMQAGANPTILDKNGKNFLFYAISRGIENENILDKAVELGCDLNSRCSKGSTILMQSVENYMNSNDKEKKESHFLMIKKLIDSGIEIESVDNEEESVFFKIIKKSNIELINFFLEEKNIDLNHKNIYGETILTYLCLAGIKNKNIIKSLLLIGANPNIQDNTGSTIIEKLITTILHYQNNKEIDDRLYSFINDSADYLDVIKLVIENSKVNLKKLSSKGQPIFFDTIIYFNYKLFNLLRKFPININQKDNKNHNIIFCLLESSKEIPNYNQKLYLDTLQNLINIGVDINAKDLNGSTPLHKAVLGNCEYTVKILLESKPNYQATDNKGRNLIHNTIWKDNLRFFKLIHSYDNSIINMADKYGVLPINYAAFMGKYDLVKLMLESKAHVNNTNDIDLRMIEFFNKYHKNIINLEKKAENEIDKLNLKLLSESMKDKFKIQNQT